MKRCPQCGREYDNTMMFCLDDGAELLYGPASMDEPATAILSEPGAIATGFPASESPTRAQIHTTDQTAIFPRGAEAEPHKNLNNSTEKHSFSARRRAKPLAALVVAVVILVGGFFGYRYFTPNNQIESIAVMPFVNESGNADIEYLSDGMTETLIKSLSQVPNLAVKSRSTVFFYKGKETSPKNIGEELGVQAVLLGRVGGRGDDLKLNLELVNTQTQDVIWSEQYDRKQSDLVTLQSEIARDVVGKLKAKLSGAEAAKVEKNYTTNAEAYQFYLKGNYFRTKYNEEGYKKGIEYYRKAIEIDPNFALAYIGIANAYSTAADWYLPPNEAYSKAKAAALKALELDNSLADGHAMLGSIAFWYEWDWATCERELIRAIELDPINSGAYGTYAFYFAASGRFDQAIKQSELAQSLTPLDLQTNLNLAVFYNSAGQYDRTIEQARKTIELDQNYWFSHVLLGLAYERKRMFPEAIAAIEKARSLDNNPAISGYLGYVYAAAGKRAEAQKILNELKDLSQRQYIPAFNVAFIYAGLTDKEQAFEWLNKAYEERSGLALIKVETTFDNLRGDPRFKDLLKRLNLPE